MVGGVLDLKRLRELAEVHEDALGVSVRSFDVGGCVFDFTNAKAVMGVINLSADSWYRESVCLSAEAAIRRGRMLSAQGADLVDVGAESTLAHAARADGALQQSKLIPVIQGLRAEGILVSVETYRPAVASACLAAGANVLNLTGTEGTETFYRMAAEHGAGVIICFVEGAHVREVSDRDLEGDPIESLYDYFARQIELADRCGAERLFIDPGLGFYYRNLEDGTVRVRHQMQMFLNTFRLRTLGVPVCHALPHAFEYFGEEVRSAEPFFAVLAALGGTDLFRTHEVPRVKAVLDTMRLG